MAWNEPGKGQDPWGGKKNNAGGPPDLDEIWQKLRRRFGGSGSGGSGSGGGGLGGAAIGLIVAGIAVLWLLSGLFVIDPGERGVVLTFGSYSKTVGPGPHWHIPYPMQRVEKVDIEQVRSASDSAVMLTKDENIVDVRAQVQYRVEDASAYLFNVRNPDETVQETLKSAVREVVGTSRMNEVIQRGADEATLDEDIFQEAVQEDMDAMAADEEVVVEQPQPTGDAETVEQIREEQSSYPEIDERSRAMLPVNIREILQYNLDTYGTGLTITAVNVSYSQPPEAVQSAFEEAIKAREEQQRLENEARAYSRDVVNRAKGESEALINQAEGYRERVIQRAEGNASRFLQLLAEYEKAPQVTRKRLYLDTMESVMQSTSKVLVDSSGGNELLYLPIDQLIKQGARKGNMSGESGSGGSGSSSGSDSGSSRYQNDPLRSRSR